MSMPSPLRVLLLEDELAFAELVEEYLSVGPAEPWQVVHVSHLCEALLYLQQQTADVILSDLYVPDAEGLGTLMALRKAACDLPVVVLTGTGDPGLGIEALRRGAQDYLDKNEITAALLERSLRYAIERARNQLLLQQSEQRLAQLVKARTNQLQREARRRQLLFDASLDGIVVLNQQGQVVEANPRFASALGYSLAEVTQLHLSDWMADMSPEHLHTMIQDFCREKTECVREVRHRRRDGSLYDAEISITVIDWEQAPQLLFLCRDISDRKQAEADLRSSEQKHRALLAALPDLVMHIDGQGNYLDFFPPKSFRLFRTATPHHNHVLDGTLPLELAELRMRAIQQALQTGEIQHYEQQIVIDSQPYDEEVRINPIGANEVIAIIRNISDRKQAERELHQLNQDLEARVNQRTTALQASESRFRGIFYQSPVGIAITDLSGRINQINPSLATMLGSSQADLQQHSIYDLLNLSQTDSPSCFESLLQGTLAVSTFERLVGTLDHQSIWVKVISACLLDGWGRPAGLVHLIDNITTEREAKAALRRSEARYRAVVEDQTELICRFLKDGTLTFVNQAYCDYFQLTADQLMGQTYWQQLGISDRSSLESQFQALTPTNPVVSFEHQRNAPNDESSWQFWTNRAVFDLQGQLVEYQAVGRDISDRKRAEAELRRTNEHLTLANSELHRATRLKDEFLASISHELRTPLNAILGMTEGLGAEVFGMINSRQHTALDTIDRSGRHLLSLINDILDLSKVEAGKLELQKRPVDVSSLCESSLLFVKPQAQKKHIQLSLELPVQLPPVEVDKRRMQQVLLNLLTNAVKFTPEGGSVRLLVSTEHQPQPQLQLTVIDTGIGIAAENIPKLFKPFMQIDSRLNRHHSGTGLGLALVRRLVDLHAGSVSLESTEGKGSRFIISLPYPALSQFGDRQNSDQPPMVCRLLSLNTASMDEESTQQTIRSEYSFHQSAAAPPLVLLAEDNQASAASMMGYLSSRGYRVAHARNGQEAIDLAIKAPPDLILMDVQMPGVDGIEATRQIRVHPDLHQIPIIALTALAMSKDRDVCLAAGVNTYLSKPVQLKFLVATIQSLLHPD